MEKMREEDKVFLIRGRIEVLKEFLELKILDEEIRRVVVEIGSKGLDEEKRIGLLWSLWTLVGLKEKLENEIKNWEERR